MPVTYKFSPFSLAPGAAPEPAPGEIHIRPREQAAGGRLELAVLALERGLDAFPQQGPVQCIVVQADPTLDDMLAAFIVELRLQGAELPTGLWNFALYAAEVRAGRRAAKLSLDESVEGVFLAMRRFRNDDGDLTRPEVAQRFLERWRSMAARILEAAQAGVDPLTRPLFDKDPAFISARVDLADDRKAYERHDLQRAQRWSMRLPGAGRKLVSGFILRGPRSALWKYWARQDGFAFLGICEADGHWRFSTDPVDGPPIATLAAALQEAEDAKGLRSKAKTWYDGSRHGHTIVAAPLCGTALSDAEVLRVVRRWARVRRPLPRWLPKAAVALLLLVLGAVVIWLIPTPRPQRLYPVSVLVNDRLVKSAAIQRESAAEQKAGRFYAAFDADLQPGGNRLTVMFNGRPRPLLPVKLWGDRPVARAHAGEGRQPAGDRGRQGHPLCFRRAARGPRACLQQWRHRREPTDHGLPGPGREHRDRRAVRSGRATAARQCPALLERRPGIQTGPVSVDGGRFAVCPRLGGLQQPGLCRRRRDRPGTGPHGREGAAVCRRAHGRGAHR